MYLGKNHRTKFFELIREKNLFQKNSPKTFIYSSKNHKTKFFELLREKNLF